MTLSFSSVELTEQTKPLQETFWYNPLGQGADIRIPVGAGQTNSIGSEEYHNPNLLKCGIDIVCLPNVSIYAVESGIVVSIETFFDNKKKPWISSSKALLVAGDNGVVCYGNIEPCDEIEVGMKVSRGQPIGKTVSWFSKPSKSEQGDTRLRFELYRHNTKQRPKWRFDGPLPKSVLNPVPLLLPLITSVTRQRKHVKAF